MRTMIFLLVAGCSDGLVYDCSDSAQCVLDGRAGICAAGACAFASAGCTSGYRYDESAGERAGSCVDLPAPSDMASQPDMRSCQCPPQSCASGILTRASTCDESGACKTPTTRQCAPYLCLADGTDCASTCGAGNNTCAPPNVCTDGSCGPSPNGAKCSKPADCASGYCSDGVCCNTSCQGACVACNLAGVEGTCTSVPAGGTDPHGICQAEAVSTCGRNGKCSGSGSCSFYSAGTVCAPAACTFDKKGYSTAGTCPGGGLPCGAGTSYNCEPYSCYTDGTGPHCFGTCGCCLCLPGMNPPFTANCSSGHVCVDRCSGPQQSWVCE